MTDDSERPLTPEEIAKIRKLMESDDRVTWFWSSVRIWAGWISAAIIGFYGVYQAINGFFPHIFKKGIVP